MLSEWHLAPDYIVNNWTDELLDLMVDKLVERKNREHKAVKGQTTVSVETLASRSRGMIRIKRNGD